MKSRQVAKVGDFLFSREMAIPRQVPAAVERKQGVPCLEAERAVRGQPQFFEALGEKVEAPDRKGQEAARGHPPSQVFQPRLARRASRQVVEHTKKGDQVEGLMGQLRRQSVEAKLEEGTRRRGQGNPRYLEQGGAPVKTQEVPRQQPFFFEKTGEATVAAADVETTLPGFLVRKDRQQRLPSRPRMGASGRKTVGSLVVKTPIEIQQLLPGRFVHGL